MRRYWFLAIAGAIAAALAVVPLSAFAASAVLTVGSTSGAAVAVNDSLVGTNSGNITFSNGGSGGGSVSCSASTINAKDLTNQAPPPGSATESVSSETFVDSNGNNSCTLSGVFGGAVTSITTNASASGCPWQATVSDSSSSNNVTITANSGSGCSAIQATVKTTAFGFPQTPCVYQLTTSPLTGSATVGGSGGSISFSNQSFTKQSGPGSCFGTANFSGTYNIVDASQSNGKVILN